MLLTTEIQQMLPTIVSRSQVIHFPVRDIETRIEDLLEKKIPEKHATILAYLTQDTDEAAELADSKIFGQIVNLVWQWFLLLAENGSRAFIFVETDIKPLMKEADSKRDTTSLIIDLLILVYRDLMSLCFNQERVLAFSDHSVRLKEIADASMRKNIADNLTILLNAKKKLNSNVAAQGVLEQIAIKMMNQSS
jgi:DNA polymerase-3 subunit delta'